VSSSGPYCGTFAPSREPRRGRTRPRPDRRRYGEGSQRAGVGQGRCRPRSFCAPGRTAAPGYRPRRLSSTIFEFSARSRLTIPSSPGTSAGGSHGGPHREELRRATPSQTEPRAVTPQPHHPNRNSQRPRRESAVALHHDGIGATASLHPANGSPGSAPANRARSSFE
jgi:hypothetical protein